jgi:hypothetical protein
MAVGHLVYPLTIGAALTNDVTSGNTIDFPRVPKNLCIQYNFVYAAGGTSMDADIQTSLDGGTTWIEIAQFHSTTASERLVLNLSALTPIGSYVATTALADDAVKDGILGNKFRAKITTTGTYTGATSLTITCAATD